MTTDYNFVILGMIFTYTYAYTLESNCLNRIVRFKIDQYLQKKCILYERIEGALVVVIVWQLHVQSVSITIKVAFEPYLLRGALNTALCDNVWK
jgi:hypothetical protein